MNKLALAYAVVLSSMTALANEEIESAIDDVMRYSCLTNRRTAHSVPEWGVPSRLLVEPSFTSLVEVVRTGIASCGASFACGMTNDVRREVFIAALASCGETVYTNAVVRWFGGDVQADVSPNWIRTYASPMSTCMDGYFSVHYDEPAIKKVWQNMKAGYLASNDTENAAWVDRVLAGEAKAWIEMMQRFEEEGRRKK